MADGGITELLTDFITTTFRWLLRIPLMVLAVLITPLSSSLSAGDANEVPLAVPTDVATSAAPLPGSATQARTKQGWAVSRIRTVWGYDRRWRDEGELHIFFVRRGKSSCRPSAPLLHRRRLEASHTTSSTHMENPPLTCGV